MRWTFRLNRDAESPSGGLDSVYDEFVPGSRSRLQKLRCGRVGLDFLTQAVDQLFQELTVTRIAMTPDLDEQSVGAYGMACVGQQHLQ